MSEKYKSAMDKITASDELKARIIKATEEKTKPASKKIFYIRYAAGLAACIAIAVTGYGIFKKPNTITPDVITPPVAVAKPDETPDDPKPDSQKPPVSENLPAKNSPEKTTEPPAEPPKAEPPVEPDTPAAEVPSDIEESTPTGGMVAAGNGASDCADVDEINAQLGYKIKAPSYIPEGYVFESASLLFGTLADIRFESGDNSIIFRTEKTTEDINGDYNVYEGEFTENINGSEVTFRGNGGKISNFSWSDGENAYVLYCDAAISPEEAVRIAENVK